MTEPTQNVTAETDAVLDQPKEEMKPVTSDVQTAKDDAIVFTNKVKAFDVGQAGFKVSDAEVLNTDNSTGGGSLDHASLDASRNPGSGTRAVAGDNPVDKLDRIAADMYDNQACQQSAMALEGAPDDFAADVSTNFKTNQIYQLKSVSAGKKPEFGQIYRRNPVSTSAEKLVFVRGQMDDASPSLGYPSRTLKYTPPSGDAGAAFEDGAVTITQGNYLIKGMNFVVANGVLTNVDFDVDVIDIESDPYVLDVRVDHGKLLDNIAQRKVTEWAKVINEKGADFYSPVASGMPQPARHIRLADDIMAVDGAIVYAAVKSMCEAYAYGQLLRPKMGGASGSMRLGAMMTRLTNEKGGFRRAEDMPLWTAYDRFARGASLPANMSVPAFISLFQSPRSFNGYFGNLIVQPTFQQVYRDALKYVDSMPWKIDKDTLSVFDKTYGWYKDTEADQFVGINRYGIVSPYNPNEYFDFVELLDGTMQLDGACHIQNSVTVSDGVVSTIGSNLFYGMVRYFQETFLPKMKTAMGNNSINGTITVDFDFATDRFTFGQFYIAEAMDKISRDGGDKYINGAYRQFMDSFGIDPFEDDVTTGFGVSNILQTASFRGLGTEPVPLEASDILKLILSDPEYVCLDAALDTGGIAHTARAYATMQMHPAIGRVSGDYQYEKSFLFPELEKRQMILPGLRRMVMFGAQKYLRSRDMPIRPYHITSGDGGDDPTEWTADNDITVTAFTGVASVMEDASPGLWESGNFIGVTMPCLAVSETSKTNCALTVHDVVSVPRVNGRIAPAPMNYLDASTKAQSGVVDPYVAITPRETMIARLSGDGFSVKQFGVMARPIETYNILYLMDSDFEARMYGTATYRDALLVNTGSIAEDNMTDLIDDEGVYIDIPAGYTVGANVLAKYGENVRAQYIPYTSAIMQSIVQNYPFVEVPTAGTVDLVLDNDGEEFHDDRAMLQANEAFGLKFWAKTYWTRYALKYTAELFDKSNDMIDNQLERMDNDLL